MRSFAAGLFSVGALASGLLLSGPAAAEDVKLGIMFGVTGQVASFVPPLLDSIKLAVGEVNADGGLLEGRQLQTILADTKGTAQGGIDAATKLVKVDNVAAIIGALTSAATIAAAHDVTVPKGVLLISPSATAPLLTTLEDNDFVFRTAPSDADQGWLLAKLVYRQGFTKVALTYINNDYGSGIDDTFRDNFENLGGSVTTALAHEGDKASYLQELQQLSQYSPQVLVLVDFPKSGITIIRKRWRTVCSSTSSEPIHC